MASARTTYALVFALSVSAMTVHAQWRYKATDDGQYRIGRNGRNLRVATSTIVIGFTIPTGWRLSDITTDETGCKFTAESSFDGPALIFSIHRKFPGVIDPEFLTHPQHLPPAAHNEAAFHLPDGTQLTPRRDITGGHIGPDGVRTYYGAALYLYVREGEYTCTFEFTGNRLVGLPISRRTVQQILDSYTTSCKKPSNQTLERTADRRDNLLSMTSIPKLEALLDLVSGRSACSR